MRLYSWIWCSSLLGILGAQKAVELSVLVNGQNQYLRVNGQSTEPYYAASLFCQSHDLNLSVEGSSCTTLLAEEVRCFHTSCFTSSLSQLDLLR